ncbi:MAG: thiolase family protein [Caulobacterales bacterium]
MSGTDPIVVVSMARTPMGGLLGELSGFSASELGAAAIKAAVQRANLGPDDIDQVLMGNCLGAGQGQAPARQAALTAGLSKHTQATTLNKMCGSGLQAVLFGRHVIDGGEAEVIIAGGMESMTNAPFVMPKYRSGHKYGHDKIYDHMALDGLEDAYEGLPMGVFADKIASEYQFTRDAQDAYALETLKRAQNASSEGNFATEITVLETMQNKQTVRVETDELPRKAKPDKIPSLKPAFTPNGTVTAANASAISDGAAALVLMKRSEAEKRGLEPLATLVAAASHAHEPSYFTTAPVPAIRKTLERAGGWSVDSVDLWEVNEAFAVVPMIAMHELAIPHEKLNVNGGACALGHPIGASGARVLVTLISAMQARGAKRGVASLCIGGGEGIALAVERA